MLIYFRVEIFSYDFIYMNINIFFILSKFLRIYESIQDIEQRDMS